MGRSSPRLPLSTTAAIVFLSAARAVNAGLWDVSIDESPAPSPEDGPPFSAHASRNRALLPYQVVGIVGAYVGFVLLLFSVLLTAGRKLRKKAQSGIGAKPREMVKPVNRTFDPSPISPASSRSWYSPRRLGRKKSAPTSLRSGMSNPASPGMDSVVSFDNNVLEADKQKRQEEMERLYAAVMIQQDRKSTATASQMEIEQQPSMPPEYSRQTPAKTAPPRLLTSAPQLQHLQVNSSNPASPRTPHTPKSPIRAIYPPDSPMPAMPSSPTSPMRAEYPPIIANTPTYPNQPQSPLRPNRDSRTSSFGSLGSAGSGQSGRNKLRKSIRNLKISAPLPRDDNSDGARTPLSPRFYTDPGIPPEPPTARTLDSRYAPTTPGSATSWRRNEDYEGGDGEELDTVRDLPQPNPQRMSAYQYNNPAQALTNAASTRPDPTAPTTSPTKQPAASVNNTLPFRQYQSNLYAPQARPQQSPGLQMTYVETRRDRLNPQRTGMATPYSPYMPFTPVTPVTPHLTSRLERKQREKEERQMRGTITEEDAVIDDRELWSSAY